MHVPNSCENSNSASIVGHVRVCSGFRNHKSQLQWYSHLLCSSLYIYTHHCTVKHSYLAMVATSSKCIALFPSHSQIWPWNEASKHNQSAQAGVELWTQACQLHVLLSQVTNYILQLIQYRRLSLFIKSQKLVVQSSDHWQLNYLKVLPV